MKPPTPDWRSLRTKLRKLHELLGVLASLGEFDVERLRSDIVATLATERIRTQVVELAFSANNHIVVTMLNRAPETYAESFLLAAKAGALPAELAHQLVPSVKLRNVLVHEYLDVDLEKVVAAIPMAIEQYGRYVKEVAGWVLARQNVSGGT
jgi:uncharacterized protein YutE (UPF0331/DUF86 family)